MREAALFLHGRYPRRDLGYYRKLAQGRFTVAVDGGYRFFHAAGIFPNLLVGDFDSLRRIPSNLPERTVVARMPIRKDATDAELAVNYCLDEGFRSIDIVQPSFGEPDHYLGNVMLLRLIDRWSRRGRTPVRARLVGRAEEIMLIHDSGVTLRSCSGDRVSLIPLSSRVRYSCTGTDYAAHNVLVRAGQTVGLRNVITAAVARFNVVGEALLIHRWEVG